MVGISFDFLRFCQSSRAQTLKIEEALYPHEFSEHLSDQSFYRRDH